MERRRRCRTIRILFALFPFSSWRYALLQGHLLRCPECLKDVADIETARSVTMVKEKIAPHKDLWMTLSNRLAAEPTKLKARKMSAWRWALGTAGLLALIAVLFLAFPRTHRPVSLDLQVKLQVNTITLYEQPAQAFIFKTQDPDLTFVWVEKR